MNPREFQLQLVQDAIAQGAFRIGEIARECGGLYPLELLDLIYALQRGGKVISFDGGYKLARGQAERKSYASIQPGKVKQIKLPEPHPHDFDWRFATDTTKRLAKKILESIPSNGRVLLLGTPSIFVELANMEYSASVTLVDWNGETIRYLAKCSLPDSFELVNHDLLCGPFWESRREADLVLLDPPWYPQHYDAFLIQSAFTAKIGARIVMILLPINTRPEATQDRWKILEDAHNLGLEIQGIEPNAVDYDTPAFERESLHAAGVNLSENWRSGDLVVLRKVREPEPTIVQDLFAFISSTLDNRDEWSEILLGLHKVKLRGPFNDVAQVPELISIEEQDVLPTVSRRYLGRNRIDLWLWDNRVFAVRGRAAFWAALHSLTGKPIPAEVAAVKKANRNRAIELLRNLLEPQDAIPYAFGSNNNHPISTQMLIIR